MSNPDRDNPESRQGARRAQPGAGQEKPRLARPAAAGASQNHFHEFDIIRDSIDVKEIDDVKAVGAVKEFARGHLARRAKPVRYYSMRRRDLTTDERLTDIERKLELFKIFGFQSAPLYPTLTKRRLPKSELRDSIRRATKSALFQKRPARKLDGPLDPTLMNLPVIDPEALAEQDREEMYACLGVRPRVRR